MTNWYNICLKYQLWFLAKEFIVWLADSTCLASSQLITSIYWHCYCTVHVYRVINFCNNMWYFYRLFLYVLPLEIRLSRGEGWDPINRICVGPKPGPGFTTYVVVILRWVTYGDWCLFGGIVDHHCLKLSFHKYRLHI